MLERARGALGWRTGLVLAAAFTLAPLRTAAPQPEESSHDAIARLIAGLPTGDAALTPLEKRPSWIAYGDAIDPRWKKLEGKQLQAMRSWSASELAARAPGAHNVLYPFSGPDLINVTTILPGRSETILLSLEPVGSLADLTRFAEADFDAFFSGMQKSLSSVLSWDFFQTKDLRADLTVPGLEGALPILLFFAARDGQQVLDVQHLFVGPDGAVQEVPAVAGETPHGEGVPGVRITLRRSDSDAVRNVSYFQVDLSAHSLGQRESFFAFVAERGPFVSYLKAASYLMFKPKYAAIERFILENSRHVLQDDAGIPMKAFEPSRWNLRLYGSYDGPIRLFAHRHQPELEEAYRNRDDVSPLPFSVGYEIRPHESNLMLATKRE